MSDLSSESSCEWVVLNEEDEDLSLGDIEQSLNLDLSYESVSCAVSDSIRSSLTSEELEWQYEQIEDYIPPRESSHIQDLNPREFSFECSESEDSNVEDDIIRKYASTSDIEDDQDLDLASISKIPCYKHYRNDHLNFVLNLMLALAVASAVGLGTGHFLGWSAKCYKNESKQTADIVYLSGALTIEQTIENIESSKKQVISPSHFLENLSESVSCSNLKEGSSSTHQEVCSMPMNSDLNTETVIAETQVQVNQDEISQNNFSGSYISNIPPVSSITTHVDWNELFDVEAAIKKFHGLKKISSGYIIDSPYKEELNIEFESLKEKSFKGKEASHNDEKVFVDNLKDNFFYKGEAINEESALLKQFLTRNQESNKKGNLTSQLRNDLNEIIQSLTAIALARLTDFDEKYLTSVKDLGLVIQKYHDFQNLINTRITHIDNFVHHAEYKKYQKFGVKYLQKMVYSLVDSVDYLMKVSFKTLSKDSRRIKVNKFSNNISKVIFNFNKKWEKNSRVWSETIEKAKFQESRQRYFKQDNKEWKRKPRFEKDNLGNFQCRRYSMRS